MEQIYIPKQDYKVIVRCFTYNQSKYIEDALNGFAMQQTDFPFVCLVMDDCSTDGEQEVIKEWMERECDMVKAEYIDIESSNVIIVPHKSNTSCTFAFYFLKQNLYGSGKKKMNMVYPWRECCEYEALCEGDDYWIVPDKLEKQVNLMDSYKDMSFCFTANFRRTPDGENNENHYKSSDDHNCSVEWYIEQLGDTIDTCTMMTRISNILDIPNWYYRVGVGDIPTKLILFERGSVGYINVITACYRLNTTSSWTRSMATSRSKRWNNHKRILNMWNDFDEWSNRKNHKSISIKKRRLSLHFLKGELGYVYRKLLKK